MPAKNPKTAGALIITFCLAAGLGAEEDPAPDLLAAADELRLRGAHEEALELYDHLLSNDPGSGAAWDGAAASLEALDEEYAVAALAEALSDPATFLPPRAVAVLADGWARRGATAKASRLLSAEPEDAPGRYSLARGRIHFFEKNYPAAIEAFKKATAAGEPSAPYYLAEALLATDHYEEAAFYLDEFLAVFPYVADARAARAEIYYTSGEYEHAAAELASALTYDPNHKRAFFDLAVLAASRGDYGSAIRLYAEVTELDPADNRAFLRIAQAYEHVDPVVAAQKLEEYRRRFE